MALMSARNKNASFKKKDAFFLVQLPLKYAFYRIVHAVCAKDFCGKSAVICYKEYTPGY